ncbi:hypothetical protein D6817_04690 [Candidatus Pacearchaeota archaeon]|nr:MAG: hypothetical protein D6817_04690 [Candidatus Pacearchaeota archaeon]
MSERIARADWHNHLRTYCMREGDLERAVDRARNALGEGGMLGVVNFADARYETLTKQNCSYERQDFENAVYFPQFDLLLVKGEEIATAQGHLLVLGTRSNNLPKHFMSLEDTMKWARDNNGIAIADHPFSWQGLGEHLRNNPEALSQLDGIEVYNSEAEFSFFGRYRGANEKAMEFYCEVAPKFQQLGALASSDGHSFREIGKSWTEMEVPSYKDLRCAEDVVEAMRQGLASTRKLARFSTRSGAFGALAHMLTLAPYAAFHSIKSSLTSRTEI